MNAVSYAYFRHRASVYEKEKGNAAIQFQQFLPMLVRAHHVVWDGWELIIHHDDEVTLLPYMDVLRRLQAEGLVRLVPMGPAPSLCGAMLWRMMPIFDHASRYEIVACRDIDSMPMPRDRKCVEEFIASGLWVHCIHDNPAHSGLMGGMTAFRCKEIFCGEEWPTPPSAEMAAAYGWNRQGQDQIWLNRDVLPRVFGHLMIHSDNTGYSGCVRRPIPARAGPADEVAPGIGVCDWPSRAFAYYDAMDVPVINRIKEIERG